MSVRTEAMTTVHLAVFDGCADWEYGYAVAELARSGAATVRTVALEAVPVTSMGGVRILPDLPLGDLQAVDSGMLILPGGETWQEPHMRPFLDTARRFLESGTPVAAICGATGGLASVGLLDGRGHTSNAAEYLQSTGYAGAADYLEEAAVTDGDLITASGLAPVEFAAHIMRRLEVYPGAVIGAWERLNHTRAVADYVALEEAMRAAG